MSFFNSPNTPLHSIVQIIRHRDVTVATGACLWRRHRSLVSMASSLPQTRVNVATAARVVAAAPMSSSSPQPRDDVLGRPT